MIHQFFPLFLASLFVSASSPIGQEKDRVVEPPSQRAFHIVFGHDPGAGKYDGIVGTEDDQWNFVPVNTRKIDGLTTSAGTKSKVQLEISDNNGCWGIQQHSGIFHAYIYHQNQAVDLKTSIRNLPKGRYAIYVFAHGDAPDQNAKINLTVGNVDYGHKSTINDKSWDYRSLKFVEGVQYVRFEIKIDENQPVHIVSQRDGSNYSMFNAIQVVPWPSRLAIEKNKREAMGR
jgi:hypothetical protein